jgi:apolipoprotein N-acyltransferase
VFALLRPGEGAVNASGAGPLAFRVLKAHPVPLVEAHYAGSPPPHVLPFEAAPWGRISAAICFDMDWPALMHGAGAGGADVVLQPAQTWGADSFTARHLRGNALRAAEGGFTLLRCASDGLSGVVSPSGAVRAAARTGASGSATLSFPLPLEVRRRTLAAALPATWLQLACVAGTVAAAATLCVERCTHGPVSVEGESQSPHSRDKAQGRVASLESAGDFGLSILV